MERSSLNDYSIISFCSFCSLPLLSRYCILYSNRQEEDDDDEVCTIIIGISHLVSQQLFSFGLGGGEDTPFFRNGYIYHDDGVCEFIFIKLL